MLAKSLQGIQYLQKSSRESITCRNFARYLILARISQAIWCLHDFCKIYNFSRILQEIDDLEKSYRFSTECENMTVYLIFANFLQGFVSSQESRRVCTGCKKVETCPDLAGFLHAIYCLPEVSRTTNIQKNLTTFVIFAKRLQDVADVQESRTKSIVCKIRSRYLLFLKSSRMSLIRKNLGRFLLFAKILRGIWSLQELYIISVFWMKIAGYLLFARILRDFYFLQKSRSISHICKNLARYRQFGKKMEDIYY